ncbi:MAG TPA: hypothetical protein VLM37_09930 [Fibrobacteraceae bacterium]|nr:hypothetical protein [Fibrobacteraceae bacterium]
MKRIFIFLALVFPIGFLSCAGRHTSPILVERGVQQYEREYQVTEEGFGIDNRLKKVFLMGYIEEGMNQDMVNMLWGPPDREFDDGKIWEYLTREGNLITRVKFKRNEIARLGVHEMIVEAIEGDRYGGSPPPGSMSDKRD